MAAEPTNAKPEEAVRGRRRKLAAILSADAVGFSRQMHQDETGTHTRLRSCRQIIDRLVIEHDGRIVGSAGDSVLADFPSIVEALTSAINIQQVLREHNAALPPGQRLEFRIGINLGDVIIDGDDIYGDGVNIATRLQQLAQPGGILISQTVYNHVRGKLDVGFEPLGMHQVKNISQAVAIFRVCLDGSDSFNGSGSSVVQPQTRRRMRAKPIWLMTAVLLLIAAAVVGLWFTRAGPMEERHQERAEVADPAATTIPVVAVLPFTNQSGDPGQDYFSDGITEDLIAALGRFSSLRVVSRGTTFAYKGKAADLTRIGRELKARYVVEGSVRRAGDRVRVGIQLMNTRDGLLLWSERYDEDLTDVFAVQDAIVQRLVRMLAVRVTRVEQERALAKPPGDLAAYDYVLRGHEQLAQRTRTSNAQARKLFQQAFELDPRYAAAQAGLGRAYLDAALFGWTEWPAQALERAEEMARKAVELDNDDARSHALLSLAYGFQRQWDLAEAEIDQAVKLNPGDPEVRALLAGVHIDRGRLDEGIHEYETVLSFDPFNDPAWMDLGTVYYLAGRLQDAVDILEQNLTRKPDRVAAWAVLTATYAELGLKTQAREAAARVIRLNPLFAAEDFAASYAQPNHRKRLTNGLQRAGLP
ncbi:adenylate/guanylate cyclase domain-containing protein [Geminicoccus roseus]|uniref:adenylate/guanylate cyclase domain-containing protein n=1 Tax=Geminicoccus roseus TaxID=404900 RepID=UPI0006880D9B|nr:adenylate/guanylate cyclase domain-containing protein [Geminicoccus roseus]